MNINGERVDILKVKHRGYEIEYACYVARTLREERRGAERLKKCSIVIDDLYDIERIISVLQDMRNEIIRYTGWQKLK